MSKYEFPWVLWVQSSSNEVSWGSLSSLEFHGLNGAQMGSKYFPWLNMAQMSSFFLIHINLYLGWENIEIDHIKVLVQSVLSYERFHPQLVEDFFFIPFFAPIFIPTLFRIVSWTLRIAFFYIHIRAGCTRALFSRTAPFLLREDPRPEPSFGQICELPIWNLRKSAQADFHENLANFASRHTSILA